MCERRENFSLRFQRNFSFVVRNESLVTVFSFVRQTIFLNLKCYVKLPRELSSKREGKNSLTKAFQRAFGDMQERKIHRIFSMKTILISSHFRSGAILNIIILLTRSELGGSKRTIKILCPHKHAFYALFAWLLCRTSLGFSFVL